jgi:hypothetical protein
MISPEGEWVLDRIETVDVSDFTLETGDAVTLTAVDRDESELLEGQDITTRKADLQDAVYAGAGTADRSRDVIGTEADYDTEVVIGVRIEGMTEREYGHVDPDGVNGIPFGVLVDRIQNAIDSQLSFPDIPNSDHTKHALIQNEAPQPFDWADYYRYDFDVVVSKFEDR